MQNNGSRWWKFDFHTHTPASMDYGKADHQIKNTMTPHQWLMDYVSKGIECIAVTDHNSGKWIDSLKLEAEKLRENGHRIYIFPSVEITTHGNIHILGIFDTDKDSGYISQIIGAVKYFGSEGDSDAVTEYSPQEVISEIIERGGVAIPAHIDKPSGLCTVHKSGSTLQQILKKASAVEIIRSHAEYESSNPNSSPLIGYVALNSGLSEVLGSDSHHPDTVGRAFTWIKMGLPSLDGLKLALLDGENSIIRSDVDENSPNIYAENRITAVKIKKTKYCGRAKEFGFNVHPWLNCIIGGRGSGKSSILEFMRTCLDRGDELNSLSVKKELYLSYSNLTKKALSRDEDGVFLDDTKIEINYLKNNTEYLLSWDFLSKSSKIFKIVNGSLIEEQGEVKSRFPVKIFSQKQIYEISRSPNYLLKIIDESDIVDIKNWRYLWEQELNKFTQLRRANRDLRKNISDKGILTGQLTDINQKIITIEQSSHAQILSNYNTSITQETSCNDYISSLRSNFESLKRDLELRDFDNFTAYDNFDDQQNPNQIDFVDKIKDLEKDIIITIDFIKKYITDGFNKIENFETWFVNSDISKEIKTNKLAYEELVKSLKEKGVSNPTEYESLLKQRVIINTRLTQISTDETKISSNEKDIKDCFKKVIELRKELTSKRIHFLESLNFAEKSIKLSIDFCGDSKLFESEFRKTIGKDDQTFSGDIYNEENNGFLNELNALIISKNNNFDDIIKVINELKKSLLDNNKNQIFNTTLTKRFVEFKNNLADEFKDLLFTWFPEDNVSVKYHDGSRFKDISQGSAGQKAATVLAFLLSNGTDPLILDQPEDDLDNQLIYELIVKRIKESKKKRQIIIITHNPNIVVNGDSELIIALSQQSGLTNLLCAGGLHERNIRHSICEIMEGGKAAFEQRYKRIFNA
jgi:ABC-type lipoprotein export system ATPase subunit/predicted metal-dependent phosphoesterase TrpH